MTASPMLIHKTTELQSRNAFASKSRYQEFMKANKKPYLTTGDLYYIFAPKSKNSIC